MPGQPPLNVNLKDILAALPSLKPEELAQVQARLALLAAKPKDGEDWLLQGISIELKRRGLWSGPSTLPRRMLPTGYAEKAEVTRAFLLKGLGKKAPRGVELIALGALAGAAIVELLTRRGIPVSPTSVLNALNRVGPALEEAFPGYWASAALGVCLKLV
jgi:hypothetical protein